MLLYAIDKLSIRTAYGPFHCRMSSSVDFSLECRFVRFPLDIDIETFLSGCDGQSNSPAGSEAASSYGSPSFALILASTSLLP
jgi:hypothetical protein